MVSYHLCADAFQKEIIKERERRKDLLEQLKRINDTTARLLENVGLEGDKPNSRLQEKGLDVMTGIVSLFNSILVYSSHSYFGKGV